MSQVESNRVEEIGNTKNSISSNLRGDNQCRYWCFTWNNYNLQEFESFESNKLRQICEKFVCQEEKGDNGTPHIQGSIKLKGRGLRFSQLKKLNNKIHWEKTKNFEASFNYCQKSDTRNGKQWIFPEPEPELICLRESDLYPWQKNIMNMCLEPVNPRDVNWVYEIHGNVGKSAFARFMGIKYNSIICTGGSSKDIANLIKNIMDNGNKLRKLSIFIFNIARNKNGKISYEALEEIKNGVITNVKYESGTFFFNPPHLWVFSNDLPDITKMSKDRWKIWSINENKELVKYDYINPLDV